MHYGSRAEQFADVPTLELVNQARVRWSQNDDEEAISAAQSRGEDTVYTFLVALHERADESVFEAVQELLRKSETSEQLLGLAILRELGWGSRPVFPQTWELLEGLALSVSEPEVLRQVLTCLGWTCKPRALPTLLHFVDHADWQPRFAVANNLVKCAPRRNHPPMVEALSRLSDDPNGRPSTT